MRIETDRLLLRAWQAQDYDAWSHINMDAEVRRYYYPDLLSAAESAEELNDCVQHLAEHGFGFLAVERRHDNLLIGGAGLSHTDAIPGGPRIEIGWILGRSFWRQGFAGEISRAWFNWAWKNRISEIVGYTSAVNLPSRRTMEAIGMTRHASDDFEDQSVPMGHPLRPHVLYRIANPIGDEEIVR